MTAYNAAGESETSETSTAIEVNILILSNINIGDIDLYDDDDNKPNLSVIDTWGKFWRSLHIEKLSGHYIIIIILI